MSLILCVGGGTLGPVTPLLAVVRAIKRRRPDMRFAWAGTPAGPERPLVEAEGIPFYPIHVAKLPRYPSLTWLTWPLDYLRARRDARRCLESFKPSLVCAMGGFTSVPVMREAVRRSIPCVIHQLDVLPGLSNKQLARLCSSVTTSFQYDHPPFPGVQSVQVSTPCRFTGTLLDERSTAALGFGFDPHRPILFVMGGGTGAVALSQTIQDQLLNILPLAQVIHLTGKGKQGNLTSQPGYHVAEFFDEQRMLQAYAAADLVVSRAGLGALSELASLSKPTILVPLPHSHQEYNVALPVPSVRQDADFSDHLLKKISLLIGDGTRRLEIGNALHDALPTDDGSALAERWLREML